MNEKNTHLSRENPRSYLIQLVQRHPVIPHEHAAAGWESNDIATHEDGLKRVLLLCKHKLPNNQATRELHWTTDEDNHCADVTTVEDTTTLTDKRKTENKSSTHVRKLCSSTGCPCPCHCTVKTLPQLLHKPIDFQRNFGSWPWGCATIKHYSISVLRNYSVNAVHPSTRMCTTIACDFVWCSG